MVTYALLCVQNGRALRRPYGIETGSGGCPPIRNRALREEPKFQEAQNGKQPSSLRTSANRVGAAVEGYDFSGQPTSGLGRKGMPGVCPEAVTAQIREEFPADS
jgi:hypothetical protein